MLRRRSVAMDVAERDEQQGRSERPRPYVPLKWREHFRMRRFCLLHDDLRPFTTSWLPQKVFVLYRIFLTFYLGGWMVAHIVYRRDTDGARWLIFITNWSFVLFFLTMLFSLAIFRTPCKRDRKTDRNTQCNEDIHWSVKLFWVLYVTSQTATVMVCIGYWSTQYKPCNGRSGNSSEAESIPTNQTVNVDKCGADILSIHAHGINAVLAICDVILSLVPFNALHFLYPCIFTLTYVVFSGIYYAAGGRNELGKPYIYSLLNYGERPATASIAAIFLVFLPAFMYIIPLLVAFTRDRVYEWATQTNCSAVKRRKHGTQESNRKLNFSNPFSETICTQ